MKSYYYSLSNFFKENYGEKIYKVSLDAGFSCPNRDGKISHGGCIFCSEKGSGEFAGDRKKSITAQIDEQLILIKNKFPEGKVVAYFQNFTNTYGEFEYLKKVYEEAISHPRVMGIAIATRPDCLPDETLDFLQELSKKTLLWLELGLQTLDDKVAEVLNRGYKTEVYEEIGKKLKEREIKFVTHIIVGLPSAKEEDALKTAKLAIKVGTWGVKIHLLYVVKGTKLEELYNKENFHILSEEEYTDKVVEILQILPPKTVVHRLTGDGDRATLVAPLWSLNKKNVLNSIVKKLKYLTIKN